MTLIEALNDARQDGRRVRHPELPMGWATVTEVEHAVIPVVVAVSNSWEIEPRTATIQENKFRERCLPVLRKFVVPGKVDEIIKELQNALF